MNPLWTCSAVALLAALTCGCSAQPSADHPRLLLTSDDVPALKAKAADAAANRFGFATKTAWDDILAKADRFAAAPTYSYSVNVPLDGNRYAGVWEYTLSDQTPPPHDDSPNYPPWTAMFQEREDSITTRLMHLSLAALVTGEDKYFLPAKQMALHLSNWTHWTDKSYARGSLEACLDTGHCTYAVAMLYDWCYDRLTPGERAQIRDAIVEKGIRACLAGVDRYPPDTNGFAVVLTGACLGAVAVAPEEPESAEWLQACIDRIRVALDRGGKDGGAFEGPMYGTYLLDSLAKGLMGLEAAAVEHDLLQHPYLATMPRYCIGLLAPDTKQIPCFGDGSPMAGFPQIMGVIARAGNGEAAWYLDQIDALRIESIYDFIAFDEAKLQPKQPDWNPSSVFVDIGYASLRDGFNATAPSLFLKSGPYSNGIGHNHYDHNAFTISYGGEWVTPDRGYHSFYDPQKRKFSLGSMGHCTVVLDVDDGYLLRTDVPEIGRDQVKTTGGRIAAFFAGNRFDYARGEAAEAYNRKDRTVLDRFDRDFIYVKPGFFLVHDTLAAPEPHRFSFLLHTDGSGIIAPAGDASQLTRDTNEVYARILATGSRTTVETYPGGETYGPYLRVETPSKQDARFTAFLFPRPAADTQFIRNGGFERGLAGWRPRSNDDLPNHRVVETDPAEGDWCGEIEKSGYYYSNNFRVPEGQTITASAKVRTTDLPEGKGATMTLYFWRAGKAFASKRIGPFAHPDWQEHAITEVVPAGTEEVCLALEFFAPGTGWFDAARIEADVQKREILTPQFAAADEDGLEVKLGDRVYVACFGEPGSQRTWGTLMTDARAAVVTLDAEGKPVAAFIVEGSFLEMKGVGDLFRSSAPLTAELAVEGDALTAQVAGDLTPHSELAESATFSTCMAFAAATVNGGAAEVRVAGNVRTVSTR